MRDSTVEWAVTELQQGPRDEPEREGFVKTTKIPIEDRAPKIETQKIVTKMFISS